MTDAIKFNDEQEALWERYHDSIEEAKADGSAVLGFMTVCDLEGVKPPPEGLIRARLAAS